MVTIFTPVYNCSFIIGQLYDSLKKQIDTDFEWVIVDDGSTDNLKEKVQMWIKEDNPFKISYRYVIHGGKHRAINQAVKMANGVAFFIVDSDDYISEDAVRFINEIFPEIEADNEIAAISGLKAYYNGTIIGGTPRFNGEYVDTLVYDVDRYGLSGDKAEIYRTDLLKKYPFSEYENEDFLFEGTVWNRIALDGYKIRYYNKVIYYCEYRQDGLSRNIYEKLVNSPCGWAESLRIRQKYKDNNVRKLLAHYCYLYKNFGEEKLCQLLDISNAEYRQYEIINNELDEKLKKIINGDNNFRVAVYGCGMYAHFFINHLNEIGYEIVYGIDRSVKKFQKKPVYTKEEELPYVDAVFVTINNLSVESGKKIEKAIYNKLPNIKIWVLHQIDSRLW